MSINEFVCVCGVCVLCSMYRNKIINALQMVDVKKLPTDILLAECVYMSRKTHTHSSLVVGVGEESLPNHIIYGQKLMLMTCDKNVCGRCC